jgi:hypothetical protein
LALASVLVLAACAYLGAQAQNGEIKTRVRLVDAADGRNLGGIVRVWAGGKSLGLPGLTQRLRGVQPPAGCDGWFVLPAGGADMALPRGKVRLEALSGLESSRVELDVDVRPDLGREIAIKLDAVFCPEDHGLAAGNTHLHLMKISKEEAEDYLTKVPAADRLRVLFISYLARDKDDASYVTNGYPVGDLPRFAATGVLVNSGEEHRHNFGGYGEGYGHVMFLGIKDLVRPVSLGPGITGVGNDDWPLRSGIDAAKKQGGTVIWCHNSFGTEDVLNALTGRLDALNVFDGSRRGTFEDNYYRYLNIGLRLPISTGTDWFLYDFARVYAKVPGPLTVAAWLDALRKGRCQATNGPLLSLQVDGHEIGDTLRLDGPKTVHIEATATGRHDFKEMQLVESGKVIKTAAAAGKPFRAKLAHDLRVENSGWLAVRTLCKTQNELGQEVFAHTSPIYVEVAGRLVFNVEAARAILGEIEESQAAIRTQAKFSSPEASARLLALYEDAAKTLRERINQRGK